MAGNIPQRSATSGQLADVATDGVPRATCRRIHTMETRILDSIAEVPEATWNLLARGHVFLRHAFLAALEETGCVGAGTGWQPRHLVLEESGRVIGAIPMYEKMHSFGEFVFDWAWAEAYRRHGLAYYPKWVAATPFSPVSGPRLLAGAEDLKLGLLQAAIRHGAAAGISSFHLLFPIEADAVLAEKAGLLSRRDVQFHWTNPGYRDFEEFLGELAGPKRRKIRQERRYVRDAGVEIAVVAGRSASREDWQFFFACHRNTYRHRGRSPFLNESFFLRLAEWMPEHLVLFLARRQGQPIGASLCLRDEERLYGRYWGSIADVSCLHFEACFYAPMEYCIRENLKVFEGGAQGEHKLARGFLPTETRSAHWLARAEFSDAVARYLERERCAVADYAADMEFRSPFR